MVSHEHLKSCARSKAMSALMASLALLKEPHVVIFMFANMLLHPVLLHWSAASRHIQIRYAWCVLSMFLPVIAPVRPGFSAFVLSPEVPSTQLQATCPHLPLHKLLTVRSVYIGNYVYIIQR